MNTTKITTGHQLTITRTFSAPRKLVFRCWTDPQHLAHWQGAPEGFTVTTEELDIRPGGRSIICMRSPEGDDHWLRVEYLEVKEPERLVFTHTWLDADRKPTHPTHVNITFKEVDGGTELTLAQTGLPSAGSRDGHREGWESALRGLDTYLHTIR